VDCSSLRGPVRDCYLHPDPPVPYSDTTFSPGTEISVVLGLPGGAMVLHHFEKSATLQDLRPL
jgi:hypothetical protein